MKNPYLGQISMVTFDFILERYALCNGETIAKKDNPALFSLLGNKYGGDGRNPFAYS